MREITFRGKRADNGEWVFGDYSRYSKDESTIMVDLLEQECYWVPSETVGQYTGLKDKNWVEIYEGDIVHLTSDEGVNYNALIVFKDGGFCAIDGTESNYSIRRYGLSIFNFNLEVIGNIYDNPELMDGECPQILQSCGQKLDWGEE